MGVLTIGRHTPRKRRRGHAIVETALTLPLVIFLFIGVYDVGMAFHAAAKTQEAARLAALAAASASDPEGSLPRALPQAFVCDYARVAMDHLPGAASFSSSCTTEPLVVEGTVSSSEVGPIASVTVRYTGFALIPIPGVSGGTLPLIRTAEARLTGSGS